MAQSTEQSKLTMGASAYVIDVSSRRAMIQPVGFRRKMKRCTCSKATPFSLQPCSTRLSRYPYCWRKGAGDERKPSEGTLINISSDRLDRWGITARNSNACVNTG